jgi:hypothetical protein
MTEQQRAAMQAALKLLEVQDRLGRPAPQAAREVIAALRAALASNPTPPIDTSAQRVDAAYLPPLPELDRHPFREPWNNWEPAEVAVIIKYALRYAASAVAAERERWADEIENRRAEIRQRAIDYLALDTEARALQHEIERLRAELEQRTAAVIVSESGQALACSASVSAAYGELRAERDALKADASRWRFWRCQWPVLTTMRVAQDVGLDLTTFYVSSPEDMDGATDAAINAARKA